MNARTPCVEQGERMRSIGLSIEFAEHVDLVAPGVALVGAAIFYLIVEILGYPLAHTPTRAALASSAARTHIGG